MRYFLRALFYNHSMKNWKTLLFLACLPLSAVYLSSCGPSSESTSASKPINAVLMGISISKPAEKLVYNINEPADYTGLEIKASWSTGRPTVVALSDLRFDGFSTETTGKKTITVSFSHGDVTKSTSYTINVIDPSAEPEVVSLDFYGFNDIHGNVVDSEQGIGIAKISTFMKETTQGKNSLLVSSGDMWQGSLESNANRGELMMQWMEELDFTSMTLGNHEFDWGMSVIENNVEKYNLPILGINVFDKVTKKRVDYAKPSTVVERGGARIGIIGAIGDCYDSISYSNVMGLDFVIGLDGSGHSLTELIKAESTRLREEESCDFIVLSVHGDTYHGDTYYDVELSEEGYVDLVFEGHTHRQTHYVDYGGVHHFQSSAGSSLSINHVKVELDKTSGDFEVEYDEYQDVYWLDQASKYQLQPDASTLDIINQYDFDEYYNPVGYNSIYRPGNELRQTVANLYLSKGEEKWTDYADEIVLGGGYISVRNPGFLPEGEVNYAQLYSLFPFDNDIVLSQVGGSCLKTVFINTTNSNYFLSYSEYGQSLHYDQDVIDDDSLYYVVMDTYTYDWLIQNRYNTVKVDVYKETGYYARDLLLDYAKDGGFAAI